MINRQILQIVIIKLKMITQIVKIINNLLH